MVYDAFQAKLRATEDRLAVIDRERAEKVRDRAIYHFKREFIIALASRSNGSGEDALQLMEAAISELYPEVTENNAHEYLNRAW